MVGDLIFVSGGRGSVLLDVASDDVDDDPGSVGYVGEGGVCMVLEVAGVWLRVVDVGTLVVGWVREGVLGGEVVVFSPVP